MPMMLADFMHFAVAGAEPAAAAAEASSSGGGRIISSIAGRFVPFRPAIAWNYVDGGGAPRSPICYVSSRQFGTHEDGA